MKLTAKKFRQLARPYRVEDGAKFRLRDCNPGETKASFEERADEILAASLDLIRGLQEKLYAQERWSLLLIFQAMDAAGKDGTIKHVMSGINPQGCDVHSFKAP